MPSASGIVADHFGRERDRALGMFSSIFPIGGVAGPIFGGLITQYWDWRGHLLRQPPDRDRAHHPHRALHPEDGTDTTSAGSTSRASPFSLARSSPACSRSRPSARRERVAAQPPVLAPARLALRPRLSASSATSAGATRRSSRSADQGQGVRGDERPERPVRRRRLRLRRADSPLCREPLPHRDLERGHGALRTGRRDDVFVAFAASMLLRRTGYRRPMAIGFTSSPSALVMLSIAPRGLRPYWWLGSFAMFTGLGLGCVRPPRTTRPWRSRQTRSRRSPGYAPRSARPGRSSACRS